MSAQRLERRPNQTLEVRAAVSDGDGNTAVETLFLPAERSRIRIESSAVCGTDVTLHDYGLPSPAVLGHHTIGRIESLTPEVEAAIGVPVGTRVAVEEYVSCGDCDECLANRYRLCSAVDLWTGGERVGMIPVSRGSGLHGGNAEYLEIGIHHKLHALPDDMSVELAAWTLPLANAVEWVVDVGGAASGKSVAVIGPGYHGLSCVAAAVNAGAEVVIAIGRSSTTSEARLGYARDLGAVSELSDPGMVKRIVDEYGPLDVVVDTIGSQATLETAVSLLGRFGTLVVAGIDVSGARLDTSTIVRNMLTVRGVRGRSPQAVTTAIQILASGESKLELIPTNEVALGDVSATLNAMYTSSGPLSPHTVVNPWLQTDGSGSFAEANSVISGAAGNPAVSQFTTMTKENF